MAVLHVHLYVHGIGLPDLEHLKNGLQVHGFPDLLPVGLILGQGGNDLGFQILPIGAVLDLRKDVAVFDHAGVADGHIINVAGNIRHQIKLLGQDLTVDRRGKLLRVIRFLGNKSDQVA